MLAASERIVLRLADEECDSTPHPPSYRQDRRHAAIDLRQPGGGRIGRSPTIPYDDHTAVRGKRTALVLRYTKHTVAGVAYPQVAGRLRTYPNNYQGRH